jgi:hypothetical protein
MNNFMNQPWWVDLAVALFPIVAIGLTYYLLRARGCSVCRHQATKWSRKWYCERCFKQTFGEPVIQHTKLPATAHAEPANMPAAPAADQPAPAPAKPSKPAPGKPKRRRPAPVRSS